MHLKSNDCSTERDKNELPFQPDEESLSPKS